LRFIVMVKAPAAFEAGAMPSPELVEKMGAFNAELVKAGALLGAEGLHPSAKGVRINFAGAKPTIIDGPFTESKELVSGFWLLELKSLAEAVEWLQRAPFENGEEIEIRRIFEEADFIEAMQSPKGSLK